MRALARDPDRRYPSAQAFLQSLLAYTDYAELRSDLSALVAQATNSEIASGVYQVVASEGEGADLNLKRGVTT
jgi:hypothetical protein